MLSNKATTSTATLLCAAIAILAGGLSAAPAHADSWRWPKGPVTRSERVFIGDLDLTAAPGRETANTRIEGAVVRVCEPPARFAMRREIRDCQRVARNSANRKMMRIVKAAHARAYARAD